VFKSPRRFDLPLINCFVEKGQNAASKMARWLVMADLINLIGQRFNRLVVVSRVENNSACQARWSCQCDCGAEKEVSSHHLRNGHAQSCGCLRKDKAPACARVVTAKRVRELFNYEPETGLLTWLVSTGNNGVRIGDVAGSRCGRYVQVQVYEQFYSVHWLVWLWMTGCWPAPEVDHRDGDPLNNRWANLREATRSQNTANTVTRGRSGVKGVYWKETRRKWEAAITVHGERHSLGLFNNLWDARVAYIIAATEAFGPFAKFHSHADELWVKERLAEMMGYS
jgi:HNH endonuclease